MLTLIELARRYIAKCPPAISGQRGHDATFHVASVLVHGFALSVSDALSLLAEWNGSCAPPWGMAELSHKVNSAAGAAHRQVRGYLLRSAGRAQKSAHLNPRPAAADSPPKIEFKPEVLKRIAQKTSAIKNVVRFISERSPVRVETQDSASVLRRLYHRDSGERVLIFTDMKSNGQCMWRADKSDLIRNCHLPTGPAGVWFLPQPVDGAFHANPRAGGKFSRRSEESVMAWRYAVLESDQAEADDWLRCLVQMPLRITCLCESGGRSIHALVRVDATSKADWDGRMAAIKAILVTLGADRSALSAVRLSRLPQAKRGDRVQRLLFLNVQPSGEPILNQPTQEALYGRNWHQSASNYE